MMTSTNIEICYVLDFRKLPEIPVNCKRIYFGHETCEKLLPAIDEIGNLLETAEKRRIGLTFVTPFLTERGMDKVLCFLEQLKTITADAIEVVTSDWGLLHWLAFNNDVGTPVAGRFITGQQLDFRITEAGRLSKEMAHHVSSCTLLKDKTLEMLRTMNVNRFEISNVFQQITINCDKKYHFSLHVPYVQLTIFRTCPENLDFNCLKKTCNAKNCSHYRQKWQCRPTQRNIYCLDNALYYSNPDFERQLKLNDKIDRIVCHELMFCSPTI